MSIFCKFDSTQSRVLEYYVFDILYLNGHDITNLPLRIRKELLEAFFNKYSFDIIYNTDYQTGNGVSLFGELTSKGYEGIIAKSPDGIYLPGKRSGSWLKVKSTIMPFHTNSKVILFKRETGMVRAGISL